MTIKRTYQLNPLGSMDILSQLEVERLKSSEDSAVHRLFRNCALAVLNVGSHTDSSSEIFDQYKDFDINLIQRERGVKLELINPPEEAFVDGELIKGIHEHLFAVLRDIIHVNTSYQWLSKVDLNDPAHLTHMVFDIVRNADAVKPMQETNLITCWGGHSIGDIEYQYTKEVGYQLGLRGFNICTGCGPGAMKGPMKGATIGHAKQRNADGRYLGLTEPSIIAAEPPNPIVNRLVILPDIEKRLEAFVRMSHAIVIFPGGAGTAEELLYLLGIMLHPENADQQLPIILTGPKQSAAYFEEIDDFIAKTLGPKAQSIYQIIVDDPETVAKTISLAKADIREYRKSVGDAYHFNWSLKISDDFQRPFKPTHENMASLNLSKTQPTEELAANLRRMFSGIVAGNVKDEGIKAIKANGSFKIAAEPAMMELTDTLLSAFVKQQRMKLPGSKYIPCYEVLSK